MKGVKISKIPPFVLGKKIEKTRAYIGLNLIVFTKILMPQSLQKSFFKKNNNNKNGGILKILLEFNEKSEWMEDIKKKKLKVLIH